MRRSEQGDSDIRVDHWEPPVDADQSDPIPTDSRPGSAPGTPARPDVRRPRRLHGR